MDDGILGGDIPYIYDIYCLIQQEAPLLGLKLQISKTFLFSTVSNQADGSYASNIVEEAVLTLAEIGELNNPQTELNLIRSCVGLPKINHLLRVCDPEKIIDAINLFDLNLDKALSRILNRDVNYLT